MLEAPAESCDRETDDQLLIEARAEVLRQLPGEKKLGQRDDVTPQPDAPSQSLARAKKWRIIATTLLVLTASTHALNRIWPGRFASIDSLFFLLLAIAGIKLLLSRKQGATAKSMTASNWRTTIASGVQLILIIAIIFAPFDAFWYFTTLLLHEGGHLLAMRLFRFRNLRLVFFTTGMGAVALGEKENTPEWQHCIILLMGPLPGLLLGCTLYFLPASHVAFWHVGSGWLVTLNFANLMPLAMLDGGKVLNMLLLGRASAMVTRLIIPATAGLIFISCDRGWIPAAIIAGCALVFIRPSYYVAVAAATLRSRWEHWSSAITDLSDEQWRDLFTVTRQKLGTPRVATWMPIVHDVVSERRLRGSVALGFSGLYVVLLLIAVITASATALKVDAGRWPILPPARTPIQ